MCVCVGEGEGEGGGGARIKTPKEIKPNKATTTKQIKNTTKINITHL